MSGGASAAAPAEPIVELCAFRAGDEEYVVDLRRVRGILQPVPVTTVPRAPSFVEGVIRLRDAVVPVVDVRRRLGVTPRPGRRAKILVVEVAGRLIGLVVDAVLEVLRVPRSALRPAPALGPGPALILGVCAGREGGGAARAAAGARPAPRLRLLLDVKALLREDAPAPTARPGGVARTA